jgi:hypothetical protein
MILLDCMYHVNVTGVRTLAIELNSAMLPPKRVPFGGNHFFSGNVKSRTTLHPKYVNLHNQHPNGLPWFDKRANYILENNRALTYSPKENKENAPYLRENNFSKLKQPTSTLTGNTQESHIPFLQILANCANLINYSHVHIALTTETVFLGSSKAVTSFSEDCSSRCFLLKFTILSHVGWVFS